ncbi:MAG: hypothetical protein WCJ31_19575, partial [Planctomycetia bacterium]
MMKKNNPILAKVTATPMMSETIFRAKKRHLFRPFGFFECALFSRSLSALIVRADCSRSFPALISRAHFPRSFPA